MPQVTWIHVEDKVPVDGKTVLVYCPRRKDLIMTGFITNKQWWRRNSAPTRIRVTHWAKLPLGPIGQED